MPPGGASWSFASPLMVRPSPWAQGDSRTTLVSDISPQGARVSSELLDILPGGPDSRACWWGGRSLGRQDVPPWALGEARTHPVVHWAVA